MNEHGVFRHCEMVDDELICYMVDG